MALQALCHGQPYHIQNAHAKFAIAVHACMLTRQPLAQENPFMHEVFDFQPRESRQQLSALDKRMYRSPGSAASKTRAVQRSHERAVSSAHKQAMLTCE